MFYNKNHVKKIWSYLSLTNYMVSSDLSILNQITQAQDQFVESIRSSFTPISGITQIINSILEQQKQIQDKLKPYLEWQSKLIEQVTQINEAIRNAIPKIDITQLHNIAQTLIDEGVRLDVLTKTGWWYCPSMTEIDTDEIKKAALKYNRGNKHAMTNLMKKSYQQNNYSLLRDTVNSWKLNQLFKKRFKVIEDTLEAHIQGKYTLSIPALLPLAEGIAADYCKTKGSNGQVKIEKAFEKLLQSGEYPFKFPDLFLQIIADVIYKNTGKAKDPFRKKLNRHGVLHGIYIHYYDAPRSLRCFILLDALSTLK